jgi:hypothetical protein
LQQNLDNKKCKKDLKRMKIKRVAGGRKNPLSDAYIAGLMDADGCVHISKTDKSHNSVSIAQPSCTDLLHLICSHHGGSVSDKCGQWTVKRTHDMFTFLSRIQPHLRVKRDAALKMIKILPPSRTIHYLITV